MTIAGLSGAGTRYAYAVGEEVVARLDRAGVFSFADGKPWEHDALPWVIAEVVGLSRDHAGPAYVLRFVHGEAVCICRVDEESIEGVA